MNYQLQERTKPDGAWRLIAEFWGYEETCLVAQAINMRWKRFEARVVGKDEDGWIERTERLVVSYL